MKKTSTNDDSWKSFWTFECFLTLFSIPVISLLMWKNPGKVHPTLERVLITALIPAIGAVALGLIHRAISKRNNGLGFFFIMTAVAIPRNPTLPIWQTIYEQSTIVLIFMMLLMLFEMFHRAWISKRSKPSPATLADAEIDARPIA